MYIIFNKELKKGYPIVGSLFGSVIILRISTINPLQSCLPFFHLCVADKLLAVVC